MGEPVEQRPHDGRTLFVGLRHNAPGVGPHFLPQFQILLADLIHFPAVAPDLVGSAGAAGSAACSPYLGLPGLPVSMEPHDGAERAPGKPPGKQFAESRVIGVTAVKTADVRCPPGDTGKAHVQSRRQLVPHTLEAGGDVPGPDQRAVFLAARPGAAEEVDDILLPLLLLALVERLRVPHGIEVADAQIGSLVVAVIIKIIGGILRLRLVQPKSFDALAIIVLLHFLPDILPRAGVGGIEVDGSAHKVQSHPEAPLCADQIAFFQHSLLDGYYHTKISQGIKEPVESSIRYKQYLNANVYVELEYHGEGTYAEIVAKEQIERPNKQPRPLNRITGIASKCKEKIGGKLFDLIKAGDYQNYSQEAVFSEETGQRNDLPRPYFTLEKYTPRTAAGKMILPAPEPQPEPAPQPPQMPSSEPESQLPRLPDDDISNIEYLIHLISENYWKILIVFLALALCIGVIVFILGGNYSHTTTRRERPAGFQEDPQRTEQEWLEEYRYVGPLAKEHVG